MAVCRSAMMPAHIPISRRRLKLTGLARARSTFHGPRTIAPDVRNRAGYAVAMLRCEIGSLRAENSSQNNAVDDAVVTASVACRIIRRLKNDERRFRGSSGDWGILKSLWILPSD